MAEVKAHLDRTCFTWIGKADTDAVLAAMVAYSEHQVSDAQWLDIYACLRTLPA